MSDALIWKYKRPTNQEAFVFPDQYVALTAAEGRRPASRNCKMGIPLNFFGSSILRFFDVTVGTSQLIRGCR